MNEKGNLRQRHPSNAVMTHYWGCPQRFFRQLCMAIKVPDTVKLAQKALADNKCVVIGLQSTGEARLNDAIAKGEDLEEFAGMKENLKFLIAKFPTGDVLGKYKAQDYESDDDDDDGVEQMAAKERAAARARGRACGRAAAAAARARTTTRERTTTAPTSRHRRRRRGGRGGGEQWAPTTRRRAARRAAATRRRAAAARGRSA